MTEEKINEIKKKVRKGYPPGELENDLFNEGYTAEEIQNVFSNLSGNTQMKDKPKNIPLWYAISIGFIILGIAILSVKYLWIYYYGYVFLILGLVGVLLKYLITIPGKK
jgi:hypothetical protein